MVVDAENVVGLVGAIFLPRLRLSSRDVDLSGNITSSCTKVLDGSSLFCSHLSQNTTHVCLGARFCLGDPTDIPVVGSDVAVFRQGQWGNIPPPGEVVVAAFRGGFYRCWETR
jgi:hypothetical protein